MVIGSGGREHALVHKLSQSSQISEIIVTPGNGGTNQVYANPLVTVTNINLDLTNIEKLIMSISW